MDGAQAVTSSTTVLDPSSTIQAAGLKDGDEVGVITAPKTKLRAHKFGFGFAAIMPDGTVEAEQKDVLDVFLTETAVAALRADGTAARLLPVAPPQTVVIAAASRITWGDADCGGDSSSVKDLLADVREISATMSAFAAVTAKGAVISWGCSEEGGDLSVETAALCSRSYEETGLNMAVKTGVVTWGDPDKGGQSGAASDQLVDVRQIACTGYAFAALRSDGRVVVWGSARHGGDASAVQEDLVDVKELYASQSSFAALRGDGRVITWGHEDDGCDDPQLQKELVNIEQVACAAILLGGFLAL
ncbi:hypothetical protein AK812_SmicGene18179 [Symbiodinium microadriaticum]|uniref:E3 ubiquitin-protein ligase HERC2 n=1 Tax=Symbiodinium microadriaticum TaxID=2951 RepID=A0A1Q9DVU7_SYMMI|nr:hypothetical protein AK812_SmicGene18179 [Symbiodinium microadriaticum]